MKKLSNDWFIEGVLDFEYKKYMLLAWLQHVSKEFAEYRLYPSFSELIFHHQNLNQFLEHKNRLLQQFPSKLNLEEFRQMNLHFDSNVTDEGELNEIDSIINFSIPIIRDHLEDGKEIYEVIDQKLLIEPIGITPLYVKEGYILLQIHPGKEVDAFNYRIAFFENTEGNYYGISMDFLTSFRYSISQTYETMKRDLIRQNKLLPNPATYLLYSQAPFPVPESILPVAKRKMLTYIRASEKKNSGDLP